MANQQKKQALLGKVPAQQKSKRPVNKQQAQQLQRQMQIQRNKEMTARENTQPDKKLNVKRWSVGLIVLLVAIIFPKPQLISYEKLGLVAESVYWPGLPGVDPVLFDSNLHPRPALERNTLYLCVNKNDPDSCQKYNIVSKQGFFAALKKLIMD
ncbi:hypothetical protein ACFOEE_15330 [Pseudoalteromonas fenneropenaei]|uniref:Uncharacterized protein n=1 Tax=Pseudoalteromonas fenneropenaei TaxID=1737459 RepID=A0ABV7CMU3_9GAMM